MVQKQEERDNRRFVRVTSRDIVGEDEARKKTMKSDTKTRDINYAIGQGYSLLGIQLFHSNFDLNEFLYDIKIFNGVSSTIFTLYPELRNIISTDNIKSYIASSYWNNGDVPTEIRDRICPLMDKLVEARYNVLSKKYGKISSFPEKRKICEIFANDNYLEAVRIGYEQIQRRCLSNIDFYNLGGGISTGSNSFGLNGFYSDILKYFVANAYGETEKAAVATCMIGKYTSELSCLDEEDENVDKSSPIEKIKALFPKDGLFNSLFNVGYVPSFETQYSSFEKFGKTLYDTKYGCSVIVQKLNSARMSCKESISDDEIRTVYDRFAKSFLKLNIKETITLDQFKRIVSDSDDSYYKAVLRGYDNAKESTKNPAYVEFGRKLADYAKSLSTDSKGAHSLSRAILDELVDSFKESSYSKMSERYSAVLSRYPALDNILNFEEFYEMFKPNDLMEIVSFGYNDAKNGVSKFKVATGGQSLK